jgi:D-aminopeptidase
MSDVRCQMSDVRGQTSDVRCPMSDVCREPLDIPCGLWAKVGGRLTIVGRVNDIYNMSMRFFFLATVLLTAGSPLLAQTEIRPRVRDLGVKVGVLAPGPLNAITDVAGVKVGQTTLIRGDNIRTGVTAILPHGGNLYRERVPAAIFLGNAYGKLAGSTQVNEMGEIETPILLTATDSVPRVADAVITYVFNFKGNEDVISVNPVVGETNDGYLSDIRSRPIAPEDVFKAIDNATTGPVEEGAVGAGTGTVAFGWKGGIGTSSRRLPGSLGGYTMGVLVQTNFGGNLIVAGVPVGNELGEFYPKISSAGSKAHGSGTSPETADGSCMIVLATDAPLEHRNLSRLAARAMMGLARTGSSGSNGSGDYVIAFSSSPDVRINASEPLYRPKELLSNESMSPLFEAVIEATEEAIYNSMFRAHDMTGNGHTVKALPLRETIDLLKNHNAIPTK